MVYVFIGRYAPRSLLHIYECNFLFYWVPSFYCGDWYRELVMMAVWLEIIYCMLLMDGLLNYTVYRTICVNNTSLSYNQLVKQDGVI